jgi:uncharacterized protein YggU (UPF0235/DUF167 family)
MKTRLALKVRAGGRRTGFSGKLGSGNLGSGNVGLGNVGTVWKLQVSAPPVDGKANDAIVRFLAKLLLVPFSSVRILTGLASSAKIVEIDGVDAEQVERAILEAHGNRSHPGSFAPGES